MFLRCLHLMQCLFISYIATQYRFPIIRMRVLNSSTKLEYRKYGRSIGILDTLHRLRDIHPSSFLHINISHTCTSSYTGGTNFINCIRVENGDSREKRPDRSVTWLYIHTYSPPLPSTLLTSWVYLALKAESCRNSGYHVLGHNQLSQLYESRVEGIVVVSKHISRIPTKVPEVEITKSSKRFIDHEHA